MATQRTKFAVGLFLAFGIGIAIFAVIWLGASGLFKEGNLYEVYFDESVQGLDIDSPVKYRGVAVGLVNQIGVATDSELIKVVLKIESKEKLDREIIAQLKSVGITGMMFVELDKRSDRENMDMDRLLQLYDRDYEEKDNEAKARIEREIDRIKKRIFIPNNRQFKTGKNVIPSKRSDVSQIMGGIAEAVEQIKRIDFQGISDNISQILNDLKAKIADANIKGISDGVIQSLETVRGLLDKERIDRILTSVEKAAAELNPLVQNAGDAVQQVEDAVARIDRIVLEKQAAVKVLVDELKTAAEKANVFLDKGTALAGTADDSIALLSRHMLVTSQNLEKASDSLSRALDRLADQPSQLIFGEPPARREVEAEAGEK